MVSAVANRVRARWEDIRAGIRPGVAAAEISSFEATHRIRLDISVVEFYQMVDGMACGDSEAFQAWALTSIGPVPSVVARFRGIPDYGGICETLPDAGDYFAFGDCMCWSHVLAVRLRPSHAGTPVVWICGDRHTIVASSFNRFWERYLDDPRSVLWPRISEGA
jgi:hypothetical protein